MSKTATLKGKITLDDTPFQKSLRRTAERARKFAKDTASNIASAGKAGMLALGAAGVGAAGGMLAAAKSAADLGGQLSDASAVTGIAAHKMLVLQQAFANAGMSGEGAAGVIAKLQAAIGRAGFMSEETEEEISGLRERISELRDMKTGMDPKEQAKVNKEIAKTQERIGELQSEAKGVQQAFKVLGLDRGALAQMDGADQLKAVFEAIGKMGTQADKLGALRMLRLPPELMVLAKDPNAFKAATTQLGQLVSVMANVDMVNQFDRISDVLNAKPRIMFQQIGAGFLKELTSSKALQDALNWFEALDLTSIGEKIGAQAAALVDIIRNVVATNGGDVWQSLALGMEFLSAKAMQMFVSLTQLAAGAAMGAMLTIFSDEGGQLAASISGLLVGAFIFAAMQIKRIVEAIIADTDNQLRQSTVGRVILGAKTGLSAAINPLAFAKGAAEDVYGALTGTTKKPMTFEERMNAPYEEKFLNMTPEQLLEATSRKASDSALDAGAFAKKLVEETTKKINEVRAAQGANPANAALDAARNKVINAAGPNGAELFRQLYDPRPTVPLNMPQQQPQQGRAPGAGMQWTFPDGTTNKGKGDTGPKQVELLERVATLLDRNLTALQVA